MREATVKIYQFEELSDKAKETARDWFRQGNEFDANFEPALTAASHLGISLDESDISYSGFWSQGDGASYSGIYEYKENASQLVRGEFGTDEKLYRIADELTALQAKHGNKLHATITRSGRYSHAYTMSAEVFIGDNEEDYDAETSKELLGLFREFANWIYAGLQADYDYRQSDEAVDEDITANEYEFTEDGNRSKF